MRVGPATTAFITGGSSGIGAGLAMAFHARQATVVIAGRTEAALRAVAGACPGMETEVLDVADAEQVRTVAARVVARHPSLNLMVNNAGVQAILDFTQAPLPHDALDEEIDINLKGVVYVTNAFLPQLRSQPSARLVQVSSGLAFVPLVQAPLYSATKAAVHAFTVCLRQQLAGGTVQVVELIPPAVATDLHRRLRTQPPRTMPLDAFVAASMKALDGGADELPIGLARVLRTGSRVAPSFFMGLVNKAREKA